jgi:ABC-2 type transport system permease protein
MTGLSAMLRKEAAEVRRTSRLWVMPAIAVFCALSGAVLTYFLPALIKAAGPKAPGVVLQVSQQTVREACLEYFSQLSQIALLAVIITSAGLLSSEVKNGTAMLVVTKPISRAAFVLSKIVSQVGVLLLAAVVGTAVFLAGAYALFGAVPLGSLFVAVGLWLLLAMLFVSLLVLVSSRVGSQVAGAGIGIVLYALLSIAALWAPLKSHSPSGLLEADRQVIGGESPAVLWPLVTSLAGIALFAALAVWSFQRREL